MSTACRVTQRPCVSCRGCGATQQLRDLGVLAPEDEQVEIERDRAVQEKIQEIVSLASESAEWAGSTIGLVP